MEDQVKTCTKKKRNKKRNGLKLDPNGTDIGDIKSESLQFFQDLSQKAEIQNGRRDSDFFAQNNCQLILMPSVEAIPYFQSFNSHVPFDSVLLFIKPISDIEHEISCPICLDSPTAPIITKCGHIFCWKCILSCILSNDPIQSCFCPICHYQINRNSLKIIIWRYVEDLKIGENVSMHLCSREITSTFVKFVEEPQSGDNLSTTIPTEMFEMRPSFWIIPNSTDTLTNTGSLFLTRVLPYPSNNTTIENILESYRIVLSEQLTDSTESLGSKSLSLALRCLKELKESLTKPTRNNLHLEKMSNATNILFYQLNKGHNVFLHPVNIRQLCGLFCKDQKLTSENCPKCIHGSILSISKQITKHETFKRYKFLSHLPLKTEITFILLHLSCPRLPIPEIHPAVNGETAVFSDTEEESYLYQRRSHDNDMLASANFVTNSFVYDCRSDKSDEFPSITP